MLIPPPIQADLDARSDRTASALLLYDALLLSNASDFQASLNSAAVRLQLANDSDQSFQFVLPCCEIESRWHFADSHVLSDGLERSATVHSRFITADRASKRIIVVDSLSLISRCTRRLSPVSCSVSYLSLSFQTDRNSFADFDQALLIEPGNLVVETQLALAKKKV